MRRGMRGGTVAAFLAAALLASCASGFGQSEPEEFPAGQAYADADSGTRLPPDVVEKKSADEPVKVRIYRSHEGLGLLCDKVPKKFNFGAYMLVTSQDPAAMAKASPDGALEVEIKKGKKIQDGDVTGFILAYPEGVYYRKQSGELVVIVHLVVDYNKIQGKCPVAAGKGETGKAKEKAKEKEKAGDTAAENGPLLTLYRVPAFDGPIRSEVYESTRPCVPWTPKPDAASN
jgi:hypothetical protein